MNVRTARRPMDALKGHDPTRPMQSGRTAWRALTTAAKLPANETIAGR